MMRYHKLLDLGLTEQQVKENLLFTTDKIGELMNVAMTRKDAKEWLGTAPPDLSVIARARGPDWLYTYMRSFYRDPESATGWNNMVFERVAMPHVLWTLSGQQVQEERKFKNMEQAEAVGRQQKNAWKIDVLTPEQAGKDGERFILKTIRTETAGSLSQIDYDIMVRDLVNFMTWMSEPNQITRKQVGYVVDAGSFGAARSHVSPLQGVLERRALRETPRGAVRSAPAPFSSAHRSEFRDKANKHDESLLRNHLSLFAALPHRAVREGHGLSNHRRGHVQQAGRHCGDESLQSPAGAGRARPDPLRSEHHQRVYRRTLSPSAADARGSGDARAARLFLFQFEVELFSHIEALENGNQKQQDRARQHVADQLTQMAPVFTKQKYMLGDEFSMLDVAISPLLWRLDYYGVTLPKAAAPLMKYAERLFSRPAFIEALTPSEKVMRK